MTPVDGTIHIQHFVKQTLLVISSCIYIYILIVSSEKITSARKKLNKRSGT